MSDNKLQKKLPDSLKDKAQYALAFGVIAAMLWVAKFPLFIITFFGIFSYFLWRTFTQPTSGNVRDVFEFYLSANDILRDDGKRWFGFEVQEVIAHGESILQTMNGAPPLVYFTLGTLYNKVGNHKAAVNHLAYVFENEYSDESNYAYATPELKNYVKILRKIEREPTEAPLMSAAVRSLERSRRNRGRTILENSREAVREMGHQGAQPADLRTLNPENSSRGNSTGGILSTVTDSEMARFARKRAARENEVVTLVDFDRLEREADNPRKKNGSKKANDAHPPLHSRKPITELLHDIYGEK